MEKVLLDAALRATAEGISTVPVKLPEKKPTQFTKWKWREKRVPGEMQIRQDYRGANGNSGMAIIGGDVSGHLEFFDFDLSGEFFEAFSANVEAVAPSLIGRLPLEKTLNGGFHLLSKCPAVTIPGSQKLAHKKIEVNGPGLHEFRGKSHASKMIGNRFFIFPGAIETKAEGGYIVCAPSPGYTMIRPGEMGDFFKIPAITEAERETLLRCARMLDEMPPKTATVRNGPKPVTHSEVAGMRPGDDFNRRGDVTPILLKHGCQPAGGTPERQQWTRPGKPRGISFTIYDGRTMRMFSSNFPPFEIDTNYSALAILAMLEYGSDFSAAARALRLEGYGDQERKKPAPAPAANEAEDERAAIQAEGCGAHNKDAAATSVCEFQDAPKVKTRGPLLFPNVMSGTAGDFAKLYAEHLEPPIHFFYMAFLACLGWLLSPRLSIDSEIKPPARLYMLILGESADDRKSTVIDKTADFFNGVLEGFKICHGVGSAEGLQKLLQERQNIMLCMDEFKQFVSKCRIDGSVLLPFVTTLFESHKFEAHTKTTKISVEGAGLSLLAASTVDTYQGVWTQAFTDIGFNNRLWLVTGRGKRKFAFPKPVPEVEKYTVRNGLRDILQFVGNGRTLGITDEANKLFQDWYMGRDVSVHSKRLDGYALRFMQLLAVNDLKREIDTETVTKTLALCDWQLGVRRMSDPIGADNAVARLEQNIRRQLENRGDLTESSLRHFTHAENAGLYFFQCAVSNLEKAGIIEHFTNAKKRYFRLIPVEQENVI